MTDPLCKQLLLKLFASKGEQRAGGHWDRLLLIRLCREHSWVEFISTLRWFILRMSKYTSSTYLNGKE